MMERINYIFNRVTAILCMDKSSGIIFIVLALLFAGILIMGCSSDTSSSSSTAQPSVTSTPSSAALYSAGDIVKNPKSSSPTALLIISYDAGTDMYERAYIYPNSDGSWGYRMDSKTEKIERSVIEKVYTEKLGKKAVSAVPIQTPTPAVTPTQVYTTQTTTVSATATTASSSAPHMSSIDTDNGATGTTVSISAINGTNFQSGITVALVKSGTTINATNVVFSSSSLLTCTFVIPSSADVGYWDVKVTNPDGQFHQFQNGFRVTQGTTSTSTTTTTSSSSTTTTTTAATATLSGVSPAVVATGGSDAYQTLVISGTNFGSVSNIKLTNSAGNVITGTSYYASSSTMAQASFLIPANSNGVWTVSIMDSSGNVLSTLSGALTVQ